MMFNFMCVKIGSFGGPDEGGAAEYRGCGWNSGIY